MPLSVSGMDIHTKFIGDLTVSIWTKEGTYVGYETAGLSSAAWTSVGEGIVQGRGKGQWTPIPSELFDTEVPIAAGSTRSFYVFLSEDALLYSLGGDTFENGDAVIRTGAAIGPEGVVYTPRTANVIVRYNKKSTTLAANPGAVASPTNSTSNEKPSPSFGPTSTPTGMPAAATSISGTKSSSTETSSGHGHVHPVVSTSGATILCAFLGAVFGLV